LRFEKESLGKCPEMDRMQNTGALFQQMLTCIRKPVRSNCAKYGFEFAASGKG
jgi:hypothetical protein